MRSPSWCGRKEGSVSFNALARNPTHNSNLPTFNIFTASLLHILISFVELSSTVPLVFPYISISKCNACTKTFTACSNFAFFCNRKAVSCKISKSSCGFDCPLSSPIGLGAAKFLPSPPLFIFPSSAIFSAADIDEDI
jgi:hypothetical protein